jgi:putative sterol carrier protein
MDAFHPVGMRRPATAMGTMTVVPPLEVPMTDPSAFFDALAERRDEPLLRGVTGTIRFDVRKGSTIAPWSLSVDDGAVSLSHRKRSADSVVTVDEDVFASVVSGETNAFTAMLRGQIQMRGDPALLLAFQRVLPGPPADDRGRQETAGRPT